MDWYLCAQNDWSVYHDTSRIATFVQKGKITTEQYQSITGEAYTA
jgi:uncharacterized XkdX family phage protein